MARPRKTGRHNTKKCDGQESAPLVRVLLLLEHTKRSLFLEQTKRREKIWWTGKCAPLPARSAARTTTTAPRHGGDAVPSSHPRSSSAAGRAPLPERRLAPQAIRSPIRIRQADVARQRQRCIRRARPRARALLCGAAEPAGPRHLPCWNRLKGKKNRVMSRFLQGHSH